MRQIDVQVVSRVAEPVGSQVGGQHLGRFLCDVNADSHSDCFDVFRNRQPANILLRAATRVGVDGRVDHVQRPCGSIINPLSQQRLFVVSQRRAFVRHVVRFHRFPKRAVCRLPGNKCDPALATFERWFFVRENQTALMRARVVTLQAMLRQQRSDLAFEVLSLRVDLCDRSNGRFSARAGFEILRNIFWSKATIVDRDHVVCAQPLPVACHFVAKSQNGRVIPIRRSPIDCALSVVFSVEVNVNLAGAVAGIDNVRQFRFQAARQRRHRRYPISGRLRGPQPNIKPVAVLSQREIAFVGILRQRHNPGGAALICLGRFDPCFDGHCARSLQQLA